jgi:excisionase family DNA binding protein
LRQFLSSEKGDSRRAGIHEIKLPHSLYRLLMKILQDLADGKVISLAAATRELTTQEAANFLGVSRQFLVRLLDQGKIAFHRVGTHRRIYLRAQRVRRAPPVESGTDPRRAPFCASSSKAQRVRRAPPVESGTDPRRAPFCASSSKDLTTFREERDLRRHEAIEQMAREAVADGVYDDF